MNKNGLRRWPCGRKITAAQGWGEIYLMEGKRYAANSELDYINSGGHKAVDSLTLAIEAGDIYGFIGHNGAWKTTTLRAVAGSLKFDL